MRVKRGNGSAEGVPKARHALPSHGVGERYYRHLLETSLEGVWVIDADGRTTFTNSRMAEILGSTVEELVG